MGYYIYLCGVKEGKETHNGMPAAKRALYALLGRLLSALGKAPWLVLDCIGAAVTFLARDVVRYRRRLVRRNLADSFPELSPGERRGIERRFYRHLGDYFTETLKLRHISESELMERMRFSGTELVDKYLEQGRDIVIYTSHFGNWEWITSMGLWCRTASTADYAHVYRPLKNQWFDRWWLTLRQRYNVSLPMRTVFRELLLRRKANRRWITGFLSDQKPSHKGSTFTADFLRRPTPFIYGTEELARKLDAVAMLFDTEVAGRHSYHSTVRLIAEHPSELPEGEITRRYVQNLEEQIRRTPEAYLWSHNRWRISKNELSRNSRRISKNELSRNSRRIAKNELKNSRKE